jgi:dihydroceramidase
MYVSEWFNTTSSAMMVLVGIGGAIWHRRVLEWRFSLVFLSVALVGVGSAAFHATLLRELQMLDELPMLYTASLLVYILVENGPRRRFGAWFPTLLAAYAVAATYGAAFMRGNAQFWSFQVSFALLEFYGLYRTFLLYRASHDLGQKRLFLGGIGLYLSAILLWFLDLNYCARIVATSQSLGIPNPQHHAWWHILVSSGLYALVLVIAHQRLRTLGRPPEWSRTAGLPRLKAAAPRA